MPASIILRNLVPEVKKVNNPPVGEPVIATRADLRDGSRTSVNPGGSDWTEGQRPAIESVSGAFTVGQTATISVSNLSAKRNGQVYFENFEGLSLGQSIYTLGYTAYTEGDFPDFVASNDAPLFGSRFVRAEAVQQRLGLAAYQFDDLNEVFFEGWSRINRVDFASAFGSAQVKTWRLTSQGTDLNDGFYFGETYNDGATLWYSTPGTGVADNWYAAGRPSNTAWSRTAYYWRKSSAANVADGERYAKTSAADRATWSSFPDGHFASPSGSVDPSEWAGEPIVTDDGTVAGGMGQISLPFYTREDQTTTCDCDRIFLNDSPERVVVGDAPTFSACNSYKHFILKQNSRANGQIEVEIDSLGPLATGPVYLYVFNRDGLCNADGYLWRAS